MEIHFHCKYYGRKYDQGSRRILRLHGDGEIIHKLVLNLIGSSNLLVDFIKIASCKKSNNILY